MHTHEHLYCAEQYFCEVIWEIDLKPVLNVDGMKQVYSQTIYHSTNSCTVRQSITVQTVVVLINFDLQIYNFFTKINVDSTAQNDLNLQSTFGVVCMQDFNILTDVTL